MKKYKLEGTLNCFKYIIFNFKRFGVNIVNLNSPDFVDYHDHPYCHIKILLWGNYYEEKIKIIHYMGAQITRHSGRYHKYPGSVSYLDNIDHHKIHACKNNTWILYLWTK